MRILRIIPLLLVIGAVGVAAGCGGDDDEPEAPAPPATEAEENGAAADGETVEMADFEFIPNDLSVDRGTVITADNTGSTLHNLTIEEGTDPEQASDELAATPDVSAGESGEVTVDLEPGRYSLVCTIGNHRELGMIGTIEVE